MSDEIQFDWQALGQLIPLCLQFIDQKKNGEKIDPFDAAMQVGQAFGIEDINAFAQGQMAEVFGDGLNLALPDEVAAQIAALFTENSASVMSLIHQFAQGQVHANELVANLNSLCFGNADELKNLLTEGLGLPDQLAELIESKLGVYTVSVYCFAAAFKIYQKAAQDARLAREHRIEIERLSREAIANLKAQRTEMNDFLTRYMLSRLAPFNDGVAAMDKAILDDDDEGFIRANAELWELFGRDSQYHSAAEFDDLMASDEVFRL